MPNSRRTMLSLLLFLSVAVPGSDLLAQDYNVGDRVQFEDFDEKVEGRIIEKIDDGFLYRIKYEDERGRQRETMVDSEEIVQRLEAESPTGLAERVWTDATGQHKVRATFVEQNETSVKIKNQDGEVKEMPIQSLSADDQKYLAALRISEDSPFAGGHIDNGIEPPKSADRNVKTINPGMDNWKYTPKALSPITVDSDLASSNAPEGRTLKDTHQRGNYNLFAEREVKNRPGGFSFSNPTKGYVITSLEGEDVFRVAMKTRRRGPYDATAKFVGDDFLFLSSENSATIWNWQLKQIAYRIPLEMGRRPPIVMANSGLMLCEPDFRRHRQRDVQDLFLVDIATGETVGNIGVPFGRQPNRYQMTPDGKRIIGSFPSRVYTWDLTDKGSREALDYPTNGKSNDMHLVDDYVLVGDKLIDLRLNCVAWSYESDVPIRWLREGDSKFLAIPYNYSQATGAKQPDGPVITIPDPKLAELSKRVVPEDLIRLKKGVGVKLVTKLDAISPKDRRNIVTRLESMISLTGARVSNAGDFVLEATARKLPPKKVTVNDYYEGRSRKTLTENNTFDAPVTNHTLVFSYKGKTLIKTERAYAHRESTVLRLKPDQTLKEAIEYAARPRTSFFTSPAIGLDVALLPGGKTEFGVTKLSVPDAQRPPR